MRWVPSPTRAARLVRQAREQKEATGRQRKERVCSCSARGRRKPPSLRVRQERVVCERNRDPCRTTTPQGFLVCDHAGRVINQFSLRKALHGTGAMDGESATDGPAATEPRDGSGASDERAGGDTDAGPADGVDLLAEGGCIPRDLVPLEEEVTVIITTSPAACHPSTDLLLMVRIFLACPATRSTANRTSSTARTLTPSRPRSALAETPHISSSLEPGSRLDCFKECCRESCRKNEDADRALTRSARELVRVDIRSTGSLSISARFCSPLLALLARSSAQVRMRRCWNPSRCARGWRGAGHSWCTPLAGIPRS